MEVKELVLKTMADAPAPMSAGQIADAASLERKEVDKAMNALKKEGKIVSPKRCFWTPA